MVVTSLLHLKDPNFGKIRDKENEHIQSLVAPHIESFNYFLEEGLSTTVKELPKVEFKLESGTVIGLRFKDVDIAKPTVLDALGDATTLRLYPKECIERGCSYRGNLTATMNWSINNQIQSPVQINLGAIPIMLKSKKCNLHGMNPKQLVEHGELANETGGFFIINGSLRVIRLLIANRRNYPIAMIRDTWKFRDDHYTNMGVLIRCCRPSGESTLNVLHYLVTGEAKLEITYQKQMLFIPLTLCLKVLLDVSDRFVYKALLKGREDDACFAEDVKMMLRQQYQKLKLVNHEQCVNYVGSIFRTKLGQELPEGATDYDVCDYILKNLVLIHLDTPLAKFHTLCLMARKLYTYVKEDCVAESLDVLSLQEAYVGGFTYLALFKEKLIYVLTSVKFQLLRKEKEMGNKFLISDDIMSKELKRSQKIGDVITTFMATGSLPSKTNCGLVQRTGLTVIVDHLNRMRDLSHLRAIHRGSYFLEMKTTEPRRLTGESWGFICPVHTPDGAPCGLLNHLAFRCKIPCYNSSDDKSKLLLLLMQLGLVALDIFEPSSNVNTFFYEVVLDGGLVGYIGEDNLDDFVFKLRKLKVEKEIYPYTEITPIKRRQYGGQYPGLFLQTSPCRLMRPVINIKLSAIEYIGTLEQNFLNIAVCSEEIEDNVHSHVEIDKLSLFSNVGMLVPFSDCNPNPRNMYQCQMGKQTMGTPLHNYHCQTSNKLYRLQYPQVALVRNKHYDTVNMEEFPLGFNAVLAIVSYTGYDMEDAMVINKCSMERGLAHGFVYKSEFIDLCRNSKGSDGPKYKYQVTHIFQREPKEGLAKFLDSSGLPYVGTRLTKGDPYYCTYDVLKKDYKTEKYKGQDCVVDKCTIMCPSSGPAGRPVQRVNIAVRIRRNPTIGDKFASRSGQKGIMSRLYPAEDMPFSERGILPDIIFNPHGIPSRMTAGKLIELIAGKSAAEFGMSFDSSPFQFNDENPAHDYFGKYLEKAGFNYYGEDVLYSGIDGRPMKVEVFEGIVYYQRLRHMVDDKWQVRATGPVDDVTRQPVKGRKRGGAIRFGEMERDALITHGSSMMLKDRLMDCCDSSEAWVCSVCGDMLSTSFGTFGKHNQYTSKIPRCRMCLKKKENCDQVSSDDSNVVRIEIPYAFRFLITELASVNIRLHMTVKDPGNLCLKKQPKIHEKNVD